MDNLIDTIEKKVNETMEFLNTKDQVREEVIKGGRDIVRESGYVISYINSGNIVEAEKHLEVLRSKFNSLTNIVRDNPEFAYSNLFYNFVMEYVEAELFYAIVTKNEFPGYNELGSHPVPYLLGILDVVGELKRYILLLVGKGKIDEAWKYLVIAESIYNCVRAIDYPEGLVPGLRRKIDVARRIIEDLRAFLLDLKSRQELINELKKFKMEVQ